MVFATERVSLCIYKFNDILDLCISCHSENLAINIDKYVKNNNLQRQNAVTVYLKRSGYCMTE